MEDRSILQQKNQLAKLIHLALMASLGVYAIAGELAAPPQNMFAGIDPQAGTYGSLRYIFYAVAVLLVILIRRLQGFLLRHPSQPPSDRSSARLLTTAIISSSLCEVPGILALVLRFITGNSRDFYFLLGLSLVLFLMYFPRLSQWEEWEESGRELT